MQNPLRLALKNLIGIQVKIRRKAARVLHQIAFDNRKRERKSNGYPFFFCFMKGYIIKMSMSADVIPMRMSRDDHNGQVRQTVHYAFNVGNAKPCVDQNGSFTPAQQVAVRFLPMFIFADRKCVRVLCSTVNQLFILKYSPANANFRFPP